MSAHILLCASLFAALTSCSYGNRISENVIEGPLNAVGLAHVQAHAVAVLAGNDTEKTVSVFYDSPSGTEITRFPVSRFASAIRPAGPNRVLIAIAPPAGPGAVELWSISGRHLSTFWMARPILSVSRIHGTVTYVLARLSNGLYAVPMNIRNGATHVPVRVRDDTDSIDVCAFGGRYFLMTGSRRSRRVDLVDTASGNTIRTGLEGDDPICLEQPPAILTLEPAPFTRRVQIVHLSRFNDRKVWIVAPSDGVDLSAGDDGTVYILRVTGSDSQIEIWRPDEYMRV